MIFAAWDVKEWATVVAPAFVLLVGVITLYVNGERAERWRRRDLHARAPAAAIAYTEMPFAIRRRQHEPEHRSAERVRLTTRFSEIQAEISVCQALIDSEGDPRISAAYRELVDATRRIAGVAAHDAWKDEPIADDPNVNMPAVAQQLQPLAAHRARLAEAIRHAARSPWRRFQDATELPDDPWQESSCALRTSSEKRPYRYWGAVKEPWHQPTSRQPGAQRLRRRQR